MAKKQNSQDDTESTGRSTDEVTNAANEDFDEDDDFDDDDEEDDDSAEDAD